MEARRGLRRHPLASAQDDDPCPHLPPLAGVAQLAQVLLQPVQREGTTQGATSRCKRPSTLPDDGAPSASLDHLEAQAAPTHPGAPPPPRGGSPWPPPPASGRARAENSSRATPQPPRSRCRCATPTCPSSPLPPSPTSRCPHPAPAPPPPSSRRVAGGRGRASPLTRPLLSARGRAHASAGAPAAPACRLAVGFAARLGQPSRGGGGRPSPLALAVSQARGRGGVPPLPPRLRHRQARADAARPVGQRPLTTAAPPVCARRAPRAAPAWWL